MAKYRHILVRIWDDPDFADYSRDEKLIYISLFTNEYTTDSGVYRCTFKKISDLTGIDRDTVGNALTVKFKDKLVYDEAEKVIFIKSCLKHNVQRVGNKIVLFRSILNDYYDTKDSFVWGEFMKVNGKLIKRFLTKNTCIKRNIKVTNLQLPEIFA